MFDSLDDEKLDSLTPSSIRRAGEYGLYRALNIGRVIAFVGSGISAAYGRVNWRELVEQIEKDVLGQANREIAAFKKSLGEKPDGHYDPRDESNYPALQEIKELQKLIETIGISENGSVLGSGEGRSEKLLTILELCESLYHAMGKKSAFREKIRDLTQDDTEFTSLNLINRIQILEPLVPKKTVGSLIRKIMNARNENLRGDGQQLLGWKFYQFDFIYKLIDITEKYLDPFGESINLSFIKNLKTSLEPLQKRARGRDALQADRRSFTAILFFEIRRCYFIIKENDTDSAEKFGEKITTLLCHQIETMIHADLPKAKYKIRKLGDSELQPIRPINDPIRYVYTRLGITRYLTTNYDQELERYLESRDYGEGSLSQPGIDDVSDIYSGTRLGRQARSGLGGQSRSLVFRRETAHDLIEFAAGSSDIETDIFHLHGRADEQDTLIVTERDYQNAYLRSDETRLVFNEALQVIFPAIQSCSSASG